MKAFAALVLLLSLACAPIYAPAGLNVPMLNGLHDAHLNAQAGTQGIQFNGAYAATEHLALRLSAQRFDQTGSSNSGTSLRQVMGTGGLGYFWAPGEDQGFRSSLNLELGGGHVDGTYTVQSREIDRARGPFFRGAAQADVGYQWAYFTLGLAARLTYLAQFYEAGTTVVHGSVGHFVFAEPALVLRAGPPVFHLEGQVGVSIPFAASNSTGLINPLIASVGLGSNF